MELKAPIRVSCQPRFYRPGRSDRGRGDRQADGPGLGPMVLDCKRHRMAGARAPSVTAAAERIVNSRAPGLSRETLCRRVASVVAIMARDHSRRILIREDT